MIPLYTDEQFKLAKSRELLPFKCEACGKTFFGKKNEIQKYFSRSKRGIRILRSFKWCSRKCKKNGKLYNCKNCDKEIYRSPHCFKQKAKNVFCSHSCSTTYQNKHKQYGTRRSKLERWIEEQLSLKYPNLKIHYNKSDAIEAELDIYIPSLKLAFELNGIFHYEPIFGDDKLNKTKNNDKRKFQACSENDIGLCVIDTHNVKYLKKERDKKLLDIILETILGSTK
jgi:hypothetical protein